MRRTTILTGAALFTGLLIGPAMAAESYHFELVGKIALPSNKGHGDIVTYDPTNHMVYVSLVDDGLAVVDTKTRKVVKHIQNIEAPNGNVADDHYVYVAAAEGPGAGKVNQVIVIDKKTWKVVGRVTTKGTSPDWLGIDPKSGILYVDSDDNNWMEVYKTGAKPELKAKWDLYPPNAKTGPDVATLLPSKHLIYQSDDSYVLEINTNTGAIDRHVDLKVKLTKKGGTKGSIYDPETNHLWVGTTTDGVFVLDASTLKTIKHLPAKGGIDAAAWDPGLGLVYFFEGSAKGFDAYNTKTMEHVAFVSSGVGQTHTGDVDPATHLIYAYEGKAATLGIYKPVK